MTLDPVQCKQQITESIGAMLLLNSSCQALIKASVAPSTSPWYAIVDRELGAAEDLVVGWRQNGYRYFQDEIVAQISACGSSFLGAQGSVDALFQKLQEQFDPAIRHEIAAKLAGFETPVQGMIDSLGGYTAKLAEFEKAMAGPYAQMNRTIADVQAQAADLQQEISTINQKIAQLQEEVQTDRDAIAKAESQRTTGIVETIFGILLTPFTGGASLILVGIGVATIAEAQEKVASLESTISADRSSIAADQQQLTNDQQQLVTLGGLSMSLSLALGDITAINTALDALRTTWDVLLGEVKTAAADVAQARTAQDAVVAQVWFDAACASWGAIVPFVQHINGLNQPTPTCVTIGQ